MSRVVSYLRALGRGHTYDLWTNPYLWFGLLWGLPVPAFSLFLDLSLSGAEGRTLLDALAEHPIHYLFLAHPLLFAVVFGAMGTVRRDLELENRSLIGKLMELATTDPLTGLFNRRYVFDEIGKAIQRSRRSGGSFHVLLFDLDRFKHINDTLGHAAGDEALRRTAAALRAVVREGDVVARYGGDEFLLLAYGDSAEEIVGRATRAVRDGAGIGLSGGAARFPEDGATAEALVSAADDRLSNVKKRHHAEEEAPARG
jgi:diguanylate cyclase (GGDEF)-like protein